MFEYYVAMKNPPEPAFSVPGTAFRNTAPTNTVSRNTASPGAASESAAPPDAIPGVLKAMSPGVVDFLFRQLVAGEPAEDVQWHREGAVLSAQAPGAELARRLAETDLDALTPGELFHYVRAAQRLAAWAEALREDAVGRYCAAPPARVGRSLGWSGDHHAPAPRRQAPG